MQAGNATPQAKQTDLPAAPKSAATCMVPRAVALSQAAALPLPASPQHGNGDPPARHSANARVRSGMGLAGLLTICS